MVRVWSESDLKAALKEAGKHKGRDRSTTYGYGYPTKAKHGHVIEAPSPTMEQLQRHRTKFEPKGFAYAKARALHRQACDEVAEAHGLGKDSHGAIVLELRGKGLGVSEIAERIGSSEKRVRDLLAA